ncbi:MAG TPA: LysR family transcriptional regulator [Anaeromyxobacteraceae bacterium]|nr:LysR family transcriptional regulator [Anaeromyxobacteraceae bacterium]
MDLNLLTMLDAVGRTGSFSGAAADLGLPKSSVSRGIARLEEQLGAQLAFRTTRRVTLTAAGAALHARLGPLLGSMREALGEVSERDPEPHGELRVTAPVDLGKLFLADVVTRYVALHPRVTVELVLTGRVVDLVAEGFDVALRVATVLQDSTLVARKVAALKLGLFAAPDYLARKGVPRTAADLASRDWVVFGGQPRRLRLDGPRGPVEVEPRAVIRCNDLLFVRDALRTGAGLGLLPAFVAEPEVTAGTLVRVMPHHERLAGHVWVVSPASRQPSPRVTAFRDLVTARLRERLG